MLTDLFPIYISVVMRVFHNYSLCLDESGALLKTRQPQTLPGPYSPGCYADDNDYNLSASDPQHISVHQYAMQEHFKLLHIQLRAFPHRKTNNVQKLFRSSSPDMVGNDYSGTPSGGFLGQQHVQVVASCDVDADNRQRLIWSAPRKLVLFLGRRSSHSLHLK